MNINEKYIIDLIKSFIKEDVTKVIKVSLENKSTWLVETDTNSYIVKTKVEKDSLLNYKKLLFDNELYIYNYLSSLNFTYFKYPELIYTDNRTYMISKYIPNNKDYKLSDSLKSSMINQLLEFQQKGQGINQNLFRKLVFKIYKSLNWKVFRWSVMNLRRKYGRVYVIKSLKVIFESSFSQKKLPISFFIHDDLFGENNYIIDENNEIYFLDFEGAFTERKWILVDIIDMCIDGESLKLDNDRLVYYLNELKKQNIKIYDKLNIKAQVRLVLLRKTLQVLLFSDHPNAQRDKKKWEAFLDLLLSNSRYTEWYKNQIRIN